MKSACDDCLVRNLRLSDHFKNGIVSKNAFKDKDPDGLSMTETRDEIKGLDDLEDYRQVSSASLNIKIGVAVMDASVCSNFGLTWKPDPQTGHKFSHLHVLGPAPHDMTSDLRTKCAAEATKSGWSRGPED